MKRDIQKYNPYPSFRPHQEEIINKILDVIENHKAHNIVLEAPVGSGKSIIGYVIAKYLSSTHKSNQDNNSWRNYIMSSQNILLDQYEREFVTNEQKNMAMIKGGDNYTCAVNGKTYSEGPCHLSGKSQKTLGCYSFCSYIKARDLARNHIITLSNLNFMILEFDFVHKMGKRDLAIFDEAHNIEKVMMEYCSVKLGSFIIKKINTIINNINNDLSPFWTACRNQTNKIDEIDIKNFVSGMIEDDHSRNIQIVKDRVHDLFGLKISFLMSLMTKILESEYNNLEIQGHSFETISKMFEKSGYSQAKRLILDLDRIMKKLQNFSKDVDKTDWIIDFERDKFKKIIGIEIKPVSVQFLVQDTLVRMSDYRIFMSATICSTEKFCQNLGLDLKDTIFIEAPSTFPIEARPFHFLPIAYMNYKEMEENLPKIVNMVDEILSQHPDEKGIIHTVSFKNAEYIQKHSKYAKRMITHSSKDKKSNLQDFYESKDKIFLSPSSLEGLDLKGDLSRFQIFIKVPYLSLGDKQIKRRAEIDAEWYGYQTVLSIVQGSGRSMRSAEDSCSTYMLDGNFKRLYQQYQYMFPSDFKETIVWYNKR